MKDMEQMEEILNSYIDGELDERKSNEIKRLIDNDSQIHSLYDSMKRYKKLMDTVSQQPAPEGLCDNITSHLEREVLLADTDISSHKAGKRHLMIRRLMTAAAVIVLAAILSIVIFDIFVPKSSRQQLLSNALRKKTIKQVMYEKPFAETKQEEDKKIVPEKIYDVSLVAILTLKTNNPIEVDWFVAKALTTTDLFSRTAAIDRQPGSVRYVINCDKESVASLMQELSFVWSQCTDAKMDIGTEQTGKYITVNNISAAQVVEICKAENFGQRLRMANDLAIINKITTPAIADRLYADADIDYDLLVTQKPALTSTEKTKIAGQPSDNIKNATLTIIVISN
jgi:L-fucose mutarotase/ribose pyranase (RbsD/FucU family)